MKVDQLHPAPDQKTKFAWSHHVTVPEQAGCYALVTYSGDVLYVGQATVSIRDRMGVHLDTSEKRALSRKGVAYWFHYVVCLAVEVSPIERGWLNQAILEDGEWPVLNKIYGPL